MGTAMRAAGGGRKQNLPTKNKSSLTRIAPPKELLSETAIGLWKTQSKILIERGTFELEDAPLLLAYCNSFHLMITAEKVITKLALKDLENLGLADLGGTGGLKKHKFQIKSPIPEKFNMGTGHINFFKNKKKKGNRMGHPLDQQPNAPATPEVAAEVKRLIEAANPGVSAP